MSEDFTNKLEPIRGAVAHHTYEEDGSWYPALQNKALPETMERLTRRYLEEFERYRGGDTFRRVTKAYREATA